MVERKLKVPAGKNPNRVLAGKRAWARLSARAKGARLRVLGVRPSKSKKGHHMASKKGHKGGYKRKHRLSAGYHRATATLGKFAKAIVILGPSMATGYEFSKYGTSIGEKIIMAIEGFGSCYTGMVPRGVIGIGSGGGVSQTFEFVPEQLLIGWGPPLVIGGVQYGMRAIHAQGNNPFRVLSTVG